MKLREAALRAPVLFLIFNRPGPTQKVFNEIKKARPARLFVAADGPREAGEGGSRDDIEKCRQARDIMKQIDWECELKTLSREKNLGCCKAVYTAIDWFFEHVEQGIILEDDCVPSQSFFRFCGELLDRYKDDPGVWQINGNNFHSPYVRSGFDYHFSYYPHVWGWATWKRAWKHRIMAKEAYMKIYDPEKLKRLKWTGREKWIQMNRLFKSFSGEIDTWDYQWHFTVFMNEGLAAVPKQNQVSNIGFDKDATHTKGISPRKTSLARYNIEFPLQHPDHKIIDKKMNQTYRYREVSPPVHEVLLNELRSFAGSIIKYRKRS